MLLIEDNFQGMAIKGDYCYERELQNGINKLLVLNCFTSKEHKQAIKYFRNAYNSDELIGILYKIISRRVKPFEDKNKADLLLKQVTLGYYSKATLEQLESINLGRIAETYIQDVVMEDLIGIYNQIKKYSDNLIENLKWEE